jgi:hypothetical protein
VGDRAEVDRHLAAIKEADGFLECAGNEWLREDPSLGELLDRTRGVPVVSFLWQQSEVYLDDPPSAFPTSPFAHSARHPEVASLIPPESTVMEVGYRLLGGSFTCDRRTVSYPVAAAAIPQPPGVLLVALCAECHGYLAKAFPGATFIAVGS